MSISPTVGAFSKYLSRSSCRSAWQQSKSAYDRTVERIPVVGADAPRAGPAACASRSSASPSPGQLFEDLGHHLHRRRARATTSTRCSRRSAGRSRCPARRSSTSGPRRAAATGRPRRDQVGFHGAALPPIAMAPPPTRTTATQPPTPMPTESMADDAAPPTRRAPRPPKKHPNYTAVFAAELIELARDGPAHRRDHRRHADRHRACRKFQAEFPDRFFDVGHRRAARR